MPKGYTLETGEPFNAKLSPIDRDQIIALARMGWSADRIAKSFPVTIGTVANLLAGRTFKTYEQRWELLHANDDCSQHGGTLPELPQAPYTQESGL